MHEFYSRIRRRLRREDVRIRVRAELPGQDWTVVRGLPVTTARKIVADLFHDRSAPLADDLRVLLRTLPTGDGADDYVRNVHQRLSIVPTEMT